jgi:hypothetical protein
LVGLAKRLEGKPFHLLAAHCQNQPREQVVSYIKKQDLAHDTPNLTVTSFGGHPQVKGNGYVPYYMVFDQHGKLAHHHMCGNYHGGDGLKMIEWVDKLLKETPDIYLGPEPYPVLPKLAQKIGFKKGLPAAVKEVEARLGGAARDEKAELERLHAAVTRHRDARLARAEGLLATRPPQVLPTLTTLDKELKGTELGRPVKEKLAAMKKSVELKQSVTVYKSYLKTLQRIDKLDPGKRRSKEIAKLERLAAENESLPIAATIKEYAEGLK